VGTASEKVAIYRGLTQDVGPVRLSDVYEEQDIPLDTLPTVWQERVAVGITAENLTEARRIVRDLLRRSDLCQPATAPSPGASPTTAPTPAPSPSATGAPTPPAPGATPAASPTSSLTAVAPTPSPSSTLPEGCEETG
jgi:protein phosphatase